LEKHHRDGQGDATEALFDGPAVDQHARGDDDAHEWEQAAQPVFWDAGAALGDVFNDNEVGVAATEEGAENVPAAGREIEESRLDRCRQVEPRVEDIADWSEERVHVPNERGRSERDHDEVWVLPETNYAPWIAHFPHDGSFPSER